MADELFDSAAEMLADTRNTPVDDFRFGERAAVEPHPVDAAVKLAQQELLVALGQTGVFHILLRLEPDEHVAHIKEDVFDHWGLAASAGCFLRNTAFIRSMAFPGGGHALQAARQDRARPRRIRDTE